MGVFYRDQAGAGNRTADEILLMSGETSPGGRVERPCPRASRVMTRYTLTDEVRQFRRNKHYGMPCGYDLEKCFTSRFHWRMSKEAP